MAVEGQEKTLTDLTSERNRGYGSCSFYRELKEKIDPELIANIE